MTREQADNEAQRIHGDRAYAFYPVEGGYGIGATSPNGRNYCTLGWGKTWQAALNASKPKLRKPTN